MSFIRRESIKDALNRATSLMDLNIQNDITKKIEFIKQIIRDDNTLATNEKTKAIKILTKDLDYYKILYNEGEKGFCVNCQKECLATYYCEYCVRNYLKENFSKW